MLFRIKGSKKKKMEKQCGKCKEIKNVSEFNKNKYTKTGYRSICRKCDNDYMSKKIAKNVKLRKKDNYIPITSKKCSICGEIKDVNEFNKNRRTKDGLQERCKQCRCKYRIDNKEKIAQNKKEYQERNKKLISIKQKQHYELNKEKILRQKKKYYADNREKCNLRSKFYYENNSDAVKETTKQYISNNKEKIRIHGIKKRNSNAKYQTYAEKLTIDEFPRLHKDGKSLEVLCKYCGKYFIPKNKEIGHRITALNECIKGDNYLYCSEECKNNCPTYGQHKYPKGFKKGTSREVSTYLRQLCFERDDWKCQKCGATENLHCHHIKGYAQNKILANDIDNVITLCKSCHKEVHSEVGCRYVDLRC